MSTTPERGPNHNCPGRDESAFSFMASKGKSRSVTSRRLVISAIDRSKADGIAIDRPQLLMLADSAVTWPDILLQGTMSGLDAAQRTVPDQLDPLSIRQAASHSTSTFDTPRRHRRLVARSNIALIMAIAPVDRWSPRPSVR